MSIEEQILTSEEKHEIAINSGLKSGFNCSYLLMVASVANATYSHLSGGKQLLEYSDAGAVATAFLAIGGTTLAGYVVTRLFTK